jgi:hypothetical protein
VTRQGAAISNGVAKRIPSDRLVEQIHAVSQNALQAAVRKEVLQRNVTKLVQVQGAQYDVNRERSRTRLGCC